MTPEPTDIEFDCKRIKLLLGNTDETNNFISRIKSHLNFEIMSHIYLYDYPKTASAQYDILNSIIDNCEALLRVLKPIGLKGEPYTKPADIETASLIKHHRWMIAREKQLAHAAQSKDTPTSDFSEISIDIEKIRTKLFPDESIDTAPKLTHEEPYNSTELDYPNQVFYSVLELKEIAIHAATEIQPKRGNNSKRNPETIRKERLANFFVGTYLDCFNKLPPMSADSPAHKAFVYCLDFAEFSEETNSHHCLKKAIKEFRPSFNAKKKVSSLIKKIATL